MAYTVPRIRSSAGRAGWMPAVEHPSSRLGRAEELSICGTPTPIMRRENTVAGYPVYYDQGSNRTLDVHYITDDSSPRLLQYPPEYLQKPGRSKVRFQDSEKIAADVELIDMIQAKLTSEYYSVKHMFRSNDPTGQGNVSREGLLKILYSLCGYIRKEQFESLLRRLGLDKLTSISFDRFISCFMNSEVVQREWVKPLQRISASENINYCTPAYAIATLREKLQTGKVDIHDVLPAACFLPGGYVVPPQLREALAHIGLRLDDIDFPKLWQRFDRQNVGALQTSQLFRELDLDAKGQPRFATAPLTSDSTPVTRHRSEVVTSRTDWVDKYTPDLRNGVINLQRTKTTLHQTEKKEETAESIAISGTSVPAEPKYRHIRVTERSQPKFDNVTDQLHYKFESAYHSLLTAFKLFDSMNDGYIARADFRQVLHQFGFTIAAVDLEQFLARVGLRSIQGQVNYRDFLSKFQNLGYDSITYENIANGDTHYAKNSYAADTLSAEELESKIVDYLHSDYMKLLSQFRMLDKNNTGFVSQYDLRNALEKNLGYPISNDQWYQLKMDIGLSVNGTQVNYMKFLQHFDIEPGSWNTRHIAGFTMPKHTRVFTPPPQLDVLRERARSYHPGMFEPNKVYVDGLRPLPELERQVQELFKRNFQTFDKHFQEMDRKGTGRMTKWQFGALLKLTGLPLSTRELDQLWNAMPSDADSMLSYSNMTKHFKLEGKIPHPPATRNFCYEDTSAKQQEKKDREKQAELERIAKRVEMERLQKERQAELAAKKEEKERKLKEKKGMRSTSYYDISKMDELANAKLGRLHQERINTLLQKIKPQVLKQRDYLKTYFQARDRMGFSHISVDEMKGIMDRLYFTLLEDEKMEVCRHFDISCNGRFHYLKFMDAFNSIPTSCDSVNQSKDSSQSLQRRQNYMVTVGQAMHTMQQKLLVEWKNLRMAFKKFDKNNDGLMDMKDLKKVLRTCRIPFTDEELYHIMSEFDLNMDGKISYSEFLKSLLVC